MIVPTTMAKGTPQTADDLTHAELELLSHCRRIQFGRIANFSITNGQPQFGDELSTERWIKFDERKFNETVDKNNQIRTKGIEVGHVF